MSRFLRLMPGAMPRLIAFILIVINAFLVLLVWESIRGGDDLFGLPLNHSGEKEKRAPKIDSTLKTLADASKSQGAQAAADLAATRGLDFDGERVRVVMEAAGEDPAGAIAAATQSGARIEATYENLIQAAVPVQNVETLSDRPEISLIRQPRRPMKTAVTSEGVADIGANSWHGAGIGGAGIKVAILDPGFYGYSQRIASGELPAGTITRSFRANGDITGGGEPHGTACAEIVHDVAPGAQLYLINFKYEVELFNALEYVKSQGINVVSASWVFPEAFPGDGTGAVNDKMAGMEAQGILWANAAGNSAHNHWSGDFMDTNLNGWTEFSGLDESNTITGDADGTIYVFLTWNKWPYTNQDYDLYLYKSGIPVLDESGNPVASEYRQTGSQEPSEALYYRVPFGQSGTYQIKIKKYSASNAATFQLFAYSLSNSPPYNYYPNYQVLDSSIAGQPADSPYALTIGAVQVGTTTLEGFSSRGPTLDGRIKPDIVAPDGVSNQTYGTFYGTSASAPHAAGAAALVKWANPAYSPAAIRSLLETRATDLPPPPNPPDGKDNLYGSGKLNLGTPPSASNYLSTWYDQLSPGMRNWVLVANPSDSGTSTPSLFINNNFRGSYQLPPRGIATPTFPEIMGGPVDGVSPGGRPMLMSQRVLYNGNFNETLSARKDTLANEYFFTWYDSLSPGMKTWILIGNQGSATTSAEVYIHNNYMGTYTIAPGGMATPVYAGVMDGPVRVRSTNGQQLLVSERVTYMGNFNEVMGAPTPPPDDYWLAWYDYQSAGLKTWVLMANPGGATVYADVYIGNVYQGTFSVPPYGVSTPTFPGVMGGPVKVHPTGGESLMVSERTLYGNSFEEVQAIATGSLTTTAWSTWYDQASAGMKNWILIANMGPSSTAATVYIGGTPRGTFSVPGGGGIITPAFPGVMGGPVQVISSGQPLLVSQRVLYGSSFNEVTGVVP